MRFGDLFKELVRSGPGKVGLALFVVMSIASLYVLFTYPSNYGTARWGNPSHWADNPRSAPPQWVSLLGAQHAPHRLFEQDTPSEVHQERTFHVQVFEMPFQHTQGAPPSALTLSLGDVEYHARPPIVTVTLDRPDGQTLTLIRSVIAGPRPGERGPYHRHTEVPLRIALGEEDRAARSLAQFLQSAHGKSVPVQQLHGRVVAALFGRPAESGGLGEALEFEPLSGEYTVRVEVRAMDANDRVGHVKLVVGGTAYGWMGTDALGRDLAQALLFGLPVALLIGLATSTVSTVIGTIFGLVSGYAGGWIDTTVQRLADIIANVPVLPLLIFLVFIGGTELWLILTVLVVFSWPGLTITVRSMVLQHRSGQEIEAAKALGASSSRIIYRHIFPHTAAYILAQLVFFAPSAILAEAGLSFLGLGDPSIPTWGQVLEHGFRTGAVFLGYWWWVIPPGILIVLTAVTFMLLALGLESAVDPRLRRSKTWRSSM